MKKTCAYIVVCALLVLTGVILVKSLHHEQRKDTSILSDQAKSLASLLPEGFDMPAPIPIPAEVVDPFAFEVLSAPMVTLPLALPQLLVEPAEEQSVPELVIPESVISESIITVPSSIVPQSFVVAMTDRETLSTPALAVPSSPATVATPSYIYFYTGIPVRPVPMATPPMPIAPMNTMFYAGGFSSVTVVPTPVAQTPVAQMQVVPIFTPRTVPSRVGAPKLVYSNGVVIKPKVYFPNQPFRNTLRGVTP